MERTPTHLESAKVNKGSQYQHDDSDNFCAD